MAATETTPSEAPAAVATAAAPGMRDAPVRAMALGLWGVVGSLLAYGVLQTAIKAAALFGG